VNKHSTLQADSKVKLPPPDAGRYSVRW